MGVPGSDTSRLSIDTFGRFTAKVNHKSVEIRTRKSRALLACVALSEGCQETRERLVGLLWSESDEPKAQGSLRTSLHEVRTALDRAGFRGFGSTNLAVMLDTSLIEVDVARVLEQAQAGRPDPLLQSTQRLLDTLLEEFETLDPAFRIWLLAKRQSLHDRVVRQLEKAMRNPAATSARTSEISRALLSLEPPHEEAVRVLIRALVDAGDIGGALGLYKKFWDLLEQDFDVEPSVETQQLVAAVRMAQTSSFAAPLPAQVRPAEVRKVQRRLLTILAASVNDYGRLLGPDVESSVRPQEYSDLIGNLVAQHHGRTFGLTGDSVMAEFASPVEAMSCAMEIRRMVANHNARRAEDRQLHLGIGLNFGDIEIEGEQYSGDDIEIATRLQEASRAGELLVSEAVRSHVGDKLGIGFEDLGERWFRNGPRPVRVYRAQLADDGQRPARAFQTGIDLHAPVPGFGDRPALAVLPLKIIGDTTDAEYIADGLTEDIINGLSRQRWLPVIARNSSFLYRSTQIGIAEIGRSLGARYLLNGTVRVANERLRVTIELVDATTTRNIWSSQYDSTIGNVFQMQDDISMRIVSALEAQVDRAEQVRARAGRPDRLDTRGLIWRGRWHQNRLTREDAAEARRLFDEALRRDPDSAEALIQLAWWYCWNVWTQRGQRAQLLEMRRLANRAMVADPEDGRSHMLAGIAENMLCNPDTGRLYLQHAIELSPSLAVAHAAIGSSNMLAGKPEQAIAPLKTALRLSPHDLYVFHALGELAASKYMLGEWDEATQFANKSLSLRPAYWYASVIRIGALARRGDLAEARVEHADLLALHPDFSIEHINWLPFKDKYWNAYFAEGVTMADSR